jgi:hypothetical protein
MKHSKHGFAQFSAECNAINAEPKLQENDFIDFAKAAICAYEAEPDRREEIARLVTSAWLDHSDRWRNPRLDEIGGGFADLELPDGHISLRPGESVRARWLSLGKKVDALPDSERPSH